jgi:glycosyltransferase 2 family protein
VTVAEPSRCPGAGDSRRARNNPVTKRWDFAAAIRFCGVFVALAPPRLFAQAIVSGAGRSRISIAISVAIVLGAAAVLYHLLRGIDIGKVVAALEAQSSSHIFIASALVIAGYCNLICYDLFALHRIGKRNIPLRVVAFASFTSYTIGHSLGAATLTCGLVRFRVYSFWQMNVVHIAKIALFTGMTYWLGNIVVLGGAAAYAPQTLTMLDRLPATLNRLAGFAGILVVLCYLAWLACGRRLIGRDDWQVALPGVRGTLLQIGIGTVDRVLASLSMYMLLPASPAVGFATVLVVFVLATLLGIVSHTPGSLGVVEVAVLIGLPQYPREELLAALVTVRMLDFFLPLMLATVMFGARTATAGSTPAKSAGQHVAWLVVALRL